MTAARRMLNKFALVNTIIVVIIGIPRLSKGSLEVVIMLIAMAVQQNVYTDPNRDGPRRV